MPRWMIIALLAFTAGSTPGDEKDPEMLSSEGALECKAQLRCFDNGAVEDVQYITQW